MDRVVALIIIGLVVLLAGCGGLSGISAYETKMAGWGREDFWPIVAIEGAQMGQKSGPAKEPAEQVIREIRRSTRRQFSAEEKIRIVLSGLRGEDSITELCHRESSRTSIIAGQRNFWRPARSAWPGTRREPQPLMRSRNCAGRPAR